MRRFLEKIDRPTGVRLLWEPRGAWPDDLVRSLCVELDLIHAVDPAMDAYVMFNNVPRVKDVKRFRELLAES